MSTIGCSVDSEVHVLLPPAPAHLFLESLAQAVWHVRWFDGRALQSVDVPAVEEGRIAVALEFQFGRGVYPVSAQLCMHDLTFCFQPAGTVIESSDMRVGRSATLDLTWRDGPAAELLIQVAVSGIDPAHVNVVRLRETINTYAGTNPWDMDLNAVVRAIVHNRVRAGLFVPRARDSYGVSVPAGRYYAQSVLQPHAEPVLRADGTFVLVVQVARGELRRWFEPAARTVVTVWRDDAGHWFSVVRAVGAGGGGPGGPAP